MAKTLPVQKRESTRPVTLFFLLLPYGISAGFVSITLPFFLTRAGFSVAAAGAIVALGVSANVWLFFWGPIVDLTLTPRRWYLLAVGVAAATLFLLGIVPFQQSAIVLLTAMVFISQIAVTFVVLPMGALMAYTVPEEASVYVDVRGWTRSELDRVDAGIRRLAPRLPGAALAIDGHVNRYPLESTVALPMLDVAQAAARDIGLPPPDGVRSGGASDGNLTAALGVPTLDGLGAVGAHPHARSEWVDVTAMPDRAALLAAPIDRLCGARGEQGALPSRVGPPA